MFIHVPAGIAGLAAAFCAAWLTAALGATVRFAVVLLVLWEQEQSVTQTDRCKLHTGHWDCCWLALTAHKHVCKSILACQVHQKDFLIRLKPKRHDTALRNLLTPMQCTKQWDDTFWRHCDITVFSAIGNVALLQPARQSHTATFLTSH